MNIRIRYKPTRFTNVYRSVQLFKSETNGALYQVEINTENLTYRVLNVRQQECIRSSEKDAFKTISTHVLKRQVKRVLYELGVDFDVEIRQPRPDKVVKKQETESTL